MAIQQIISNANGTQSGKTALGNPVHTEFDQNNNIISNPKDINQPLWFPDTLPNNAGPFSLESSSESYTYNLNAIVQEHLQSSDYGIDPTLDILSTIAIDFFKHGSQDLQRNQPQNDGSTESKSGPDNDLVDAANYYYGYTLRNIGIPEYAITKIGRAVVERLGGHYEAADVQAGIDYYNSSHADSDNNLFDGPGTTFDDPKFGGPPPPTVHSEPLLIDLNGTGNLTSSINAGSRFDADGNGFREATGWAAPGEGILVYDAGAGTITNGSSLFGTSMKLPDGSFALDGFQALAQYDANADTVIDSNDTVWSSLKVWVNSNGKPGSGQLMSLDQVGIQSISLSHTATTLTDTAGNQILATSSFTWTAGGTGEIADVNFVTNPTLSTPDNLVAVSSVIAALPEVRGYGFVTSLHQAMQLDATGALEAFVQQFVSATTDTQRDTLVNQIIAQWAGVEGVASSSRGSYVNGQELAALEQFVGRSYTDPVTGMSDPGSEATANVVSTAYTRFHDQIYSQLMLQSTLASLYSTIVPQFNTATGSFAWDFSAAQATLLSGLSTNRAATLTQLAEFNRTVHTLGLDTDSGYSVFRTTLVSHGADVAATFPFGTAVVQGTVVSESPPPHFGAVLV